MPPLDENVPLDQLEAGNVTPPNDELPPGDDEVPPNDELPPGDDEVPPQPRSRAEARIHKLANERAEALARAKMMEEQAEFYRRQAEEAARQRQTPPVEEEYVDPQVKWQRETEARVNQALFIAEDKNDKASYLLAKATSALHGKYEQRVEEELQRIRRSGGNATREGVLSYLVGRDVMANQGKPTRSSKQAAERVVTARSAPAGTRSNVSPQPAGKTAEDRLKDVIL